jgi:hypothetical protein
VNNKPLLSQFRITASMQHYVLRLRLRGGDYDFGSDSEAAVAFTKHIGEMRRILMEKRIPAIVADRAILKTLEAAVDFQLAAIRYRFIKIMEDQSHGALDRLIDTLRKLRDAIARLPPRSKGELNRQITEVLCQPIFDTEVFIDLIEALAAALPKLSPERHAKSALAIIDSEPKEGRRSPVIDMWETMSATTRVSVEGLIEPTTSTSLVPWLGRLVDLLHRERPTRKPGVPRAITRVFVSRVAAIWRTLGLNPGLAYNFFLYPATDEEIGRGGRTESRFQRYCHAALAAFGDLTEISARQVQQVRKSGAETKLPKGEPR